ncbi:MAG: hypothetical protein WB524_13590 [Acidobacteriaceae bacterium]
MTGAPVQTPCLTPVVGGLFRAKAGQICLTLTDTTGNTDFDTQNCEVDDISVTPNVKVANDSLTAKKWCFTLKAGKMYSVHLVFTQVAAIGSKANLAACGINLMVIDDTNQIQLWKVQA